MSELLAAERVTCVAGGRPVVEEATLRIRSGESVALLGPSGSGKTILLTTMGGLASPQAGQVTFRGKQLEMGSENQRRIATVFQTYGLFPLLTVAENVELALRAMGLQPGDARLSAQEALRWLSLERFAHHLTQELSGGQEQRVAVARALAVSPDVILADEPTTEQDEANRDLVLDCLLAVTTRGAAVLIATHDDEVARRCGRVVEIHDGRLTAGEHRESR